MTVAKSIDKKSLLQTLAAGLQSLLGTLAFILTSLGSLLFVEPFPFRKVSAGALKPKSCKHLCIFSHFDKHNLIDNYVVRLLQELHACGCEIIFVSTCKRLRPNEIKKIEAYCTRIAIRRNYGKDFGSYKFGLKLAGGLEGYELVLLVNDSVYGPLYPLQPVFEFGQKGSFDFWGITDSWQTHFHLQAYFLAFKKNVFLSKSFKRFWNRVRCIPMRGLIVKHYELGLTKFFLRKSYRAGAWCDYMAVTQRFLKQSEGIEPSQEPQTFEFILKKIPVNPCSHLWYFLIAEFKCPFIKRDLLIVNPDEVDLGHWPTLLEKCSDYDRNLILAHLKRIV